MRAFDDGGTADGADDRWVLVCKDEQMTELGGKNIRLTTAPADLTNPFPPRFHSLDAWRGLPARDDAAKMAATQKPWSEPVANADSVGVNAFGR